MSLEDKLVKQRAEKTQEDGSLKQKLEGEKELKDILEAHKKQTVVKGEIDSLTRTSNDLKASRKNLLLKYVALKDSFYTAEETQGVYKAQVAPLKEFLDKYEDILKDKGISDTVSLVNDKEYGGEDESLDYKESDANRKKAFANLSKLKKERPDLNFRGGIKEGEEKSPRKQSFELMQNEVKELDVKNAEVEKKIEELSLSIHEDLERKVIELARPEFDKILDKRDFNDDSFLINQKPGLIMYDKYYKMADNFSENIVKQLLTEKIAIVSYEKPLAELKSDNKEDIKSSIDYLWLSSEIKNTIKNPNLKEKELLAYLKDKKTLENMSRDCDFAFSNLPVKEDFIIADNNLGGVRINVNNYYYNTLSEELKKITSDYLEDIKIKQDKDHNIAYRGGLFTSKSKKEVASDRYELFHKISREIDNGGLNRGVSKETITMASELHDKQFLSDEDYNKFQEIRTGHNKIVDNYKEENRNKSDYSSILENYNSNLKSSEFNKSIISSLFKKGEVVNTEEIIKRTKNALEEINKEGEVSGLEEKGQELKAKIADLIKMIEKNRSNIKSKYSRDINAYDFNKYFSDKNISDSLSR